jgi:hypothetical protein
MRSLQPHNLISYLGFLGLVFFLACSNQEQNIVDQEENIVESEDKENNVVARSDKDKTPEENQRSTPFTLPMVNYDLIPDEFAKVDQYLRISVRDDLEVNEHDSSLEDLASMSSESPVKRIPLILCSPETLLKKIFPVIKALQSAGWKRVYAQVLRQDDSVGFLPLSLEKIADNRHTTLTQTILSLGKDGAVLLNQHKQIPYSGVHLNEPVNNLRRRILKNQNVKPAGRPQLYISLEETDNWGSATTLLSLAAEAGSSETLLVFSGYPFAIPAISAPSPR